MENNRSGIPTLETGTLYANRYRIVASIGRGGMGSVYLAGDVRLNGKLRALKLTASPEGERDSFIREAKILSDLQHPHLPGIVDYYPPEPGGPAAIVMEYIAGETLAEIYTRCRNRLPFHRVLPYLSQLCGLLCYLHARNPQIVFRDLKPANVLIDRHDRAILVDFGIARMYRADAAADTERLGTPAFAAPEQMRGEQTDARTDLYGWGALAYYLLSGGQFAYRLTGSVRSKLQEDVPAGFCDLLESALAADPDQRPQSASALKLLLLEFESAGNLADDVSGRMRRTDAERPDGVIAAAVLSAYPGAGATFSALGLSRFLSRQGVVHALVECPGGEAELYGLLDGERRKPKFAVFADPSGQGDASPAWREDNAFWYPLGPHDGSGLPGPGFAAWIRRLGVPLVLLDVSSRWERGQVAEWLVGSGIQSMWWVADCLPAKWSPRRQSAAAELQEKALGRGISAGWIANRDHHFPHRKEWLSCFPSAPVACLPQLPQEAVVRAVWSGQGRPPEPKYAEATDRAFQKWCKEVIVSQGR